MILPFLRLEPKADCYQVFLFFLTLCFWGWGCVGLLPSGGSNSVKSIPTLFPTMDKLDNRIKTY
jgi:hypothetical protein